MAEAVREFQAMFTVVDKATRQATDITRNIKKQADHATKAAHIPITAEDQATAEIRKVQAQADKLFNVFTQPLSLTIRDFASAGIAKISAALTALKAQGIIPVGLSIGGAAAGLAVGGVAAGLGAMALGGFAASSVNVAAGFEQSMANVASVTGGGIESQEKLAEAARKAGATSVFSASQAGDAMYYLASAGMNTEQIISSLGSTLSLSAAGGLDLARGGEIMSSTLAQFSMAAEEADRVANVLSATASKSNTNIHQLGEALTYVGPVAAAMGWDIEETNAALGALANAGFKSTMGGTALRGILSDLMNVTPQATKALKAYGISASDIDPRTHSLAETIDLFNEKGVDGAAIMKIFGDRAGPGLLALLSQGGDALRTMESDITGTAKASEMAKTQVSTFQGAMKMWRSAVEELQITIGNLLLPILTTLVRIMTAILVPVTQVINGFLKLAGAIPGSEFLAMYVGLAAVGGAIKFLLLLLGPTIAKLHLMANAKLVLAMYSNIAKAAIGGLGNAMKFAYSNPIVLVLALVAGIAILLYKTGYLQKAWEKFVNSPVGEDFMALVKFLKEGAGAAFGAINARWEIMSPEVTKILTSIADVLGGTFLWMVDLQLKYIETIIAILRKLWGFGEFLWGWAAKIITFLKELPDNIKIALQESMPSVFGPVGLEGAKLDAAFSNWAGTQPGASSEEIAAFLEYMKNPSKEQYQIVLDMLGSGQFKEWREKYAALGTGGNTNQVAGSPTNYGEYSIIETDDAGKSTKIEVWRPSILGGNTEVDMNKFANDLDILAGADGIDYVPKTGLALIHKGERVIKANQNAAGSQNINISIPMSNFTISSDSDKRWLESTMRRIATDAVKTAVAQRRT